MVNIEYSRFYIIKNMFLSKIDNWLRKKEEIIFNINIIFLKLSLKCMKKKMIGIIYSRICQKMQLNLINKSFGYNEINNKFNLLD